MELIPVPTQILGFFSSHLRKAGELGHFRTTRRKDFCANDYK